MGGSGSGSSSGGYSENRIRLAPYIERAHERLTDGSGADVPTLSVIAAMNTAFNSSPYTAHVADDINEGFFGLVQGDPTTAYEIKSFPSLFDMFGKFVGGLDVHALWADVYEDVVHGPEIEASVSAHSALLQDDINTNVLPEFLAGMRDINAIQSSAFVIGKSLIASTQVKSVNDFQARLRMSAINLSAQIWQGHLNWSSSVSSLYAEHIKLYYATKLDTDQAALEYSAKDQLWNLGLYDNARAMLGAVGGGGGSPATGALNQPSQSAKVMGGALSGAAAGATVGSAVPGIGTAVGAAVGGVLGAAGGAFS